ncbi:unnamed protein product [Symbiodinium pilosum]|uniref:Uncharacterized protein n=1 Tax=Symbiodinium pilosum TaxID=2952 RepID=A0A812KT51_SYMPI|nr:unnamed protein product [Symbiodinium pilosum]
MNPPEMNLVQRASIYEYSKQVSSLDRFLSHTWHTPGWRKFLSLLVQSGSRFMLACWAMGTGLAFALCMLDVLPLFYTTRTWALQQDMAVGCWVTLGGLVSGIGSLFVVSRADDLMKRGIYNIGGVLAVSANLHVLWSAPYLSRLWCVFELAAYRKMNPTGRITKAPLYLESFACQIFLCFHAASIGLSFARIFYDLGQIFVLALLLGAGVCSFPVAYSLRQKSLERQRLLLGLDTFEVREVECRDEFDRNYIHNAIKSWYGSLDAFSEYVRGPFREEVHLHFQLPVLYNCIIMTPLTAFCLDFVVAMLKTNAPAGDVLAYVLGFIVAQNMLWYPASLTLLVYACEHLPASAFRGNLYLQTLAISGGLWILYALGVGYWAPQPSDVPAPESVLDALALLDVYTGPTECAPQGYLDCFYRDFLQAHDQYLHDHQRLIDQAEIEASAPMPWLPLRVMETVDLEVAVWPHLYWCRSMCETFVRSTDERRLAARMPWTRSRAGTLTRSRTTPGRWTRSWMRHRSAENANTEDEEPAGDGHEAEVKEARQSAKFVYDLWLWSSLGGARNAAPTSLRGALAGRSFSPLCWRNMHAGLVDCARQIGFFSLFITIAPLEMSAPYHRWLEDELRKACRSRTHLPAAETFHLAHLLFQVAEGLLAGTNKQQSRVHLHLLVWLKNCEHVDWPRIIWADIPNPETEPAARPRQRLSARLGAQCLGPAERPRGVCAPVPHGRADGRWPRVALQYSSTYTAKFSDQFATSWPNEEATDFQLARKVLMEYHPLEPEVWLQPGGQRFRHLLQTGILRRVVLRPPWRGFQPTRWEQLCMASAWCSEDCTLLQFLRLCTEAGEKRKNQRRVLVAAAMDSLPGELLRAVAPLECYRMLALCLLKRPGFWRRPHDVQAELQLEGYRDAHISNVLSMLESCTGVIDAYLAGDLSLDNHGLPLPDYFLHAPEVGYRGELGPEQAVVVEHVRTMVNMALQQRYPEDADPDAMQTFVRFWQEHGRGSSHPLSGGSWGARGHCVPHWDAGQRLPRQVPRLLDVDTLHGVFLLHLPQEQTWDCMFCIDMVVIDEVGQLSQHTVERLPPASGHGQHSRVQQPPLAAICGAASAHHAALQVPGSALEAGLRSRIGSSCCASSVGTGPCRIVGPDILHETPQTLFLTITRRSAALLNDLAVQALYADAAPLCYVPGDYESNVGNYDHAGQLVDCEPLQVPIYQGMRVTLTCNLQKEQNFVNGMSCTVLGVQRNSVLVRTQCGNVLSVFPYTDDEIVIHGQQRRATYLPLRLGYAVTLMKVQGATLQHITLWLDVPNVEAAAYVALSRVQHDKDWRFLGHLTRRHFTPASGI